MSITIGRCGRCGFGQKKEATTRAAKETTEPEKEQLPPIVPELTTVPPTPLVIPFEATRDEVTKEIANAYYRMARGEADMAKASDVLEEIRSLLMTEKNALKIWKILSKDIGAAEVKSRKALVDLRKWFSRELFSQLEKRLRELFDGDREAAWTEWLILYSEALAYWRLPLCRRLVNLSVQFPDEFKKRNFKRQTQLILHERWTEVHPFFSSLAAHEFINPIARARLLITVGQIYLYFISPPERALPFFNEAQSLAPNLPRCVSALGDYYLQTNEMETAKIFFERVIGVGSDEPEAYTGMGDLATKQGNLEEARNWYQEAINKAGAHTLGYTQLLRLYGRPEFIDRYESQITALAERASAVDEMGAYRIFLDVGDAYGASKRFDEAQAKYQRAIDLDRKRVDGYMWKGFAYIDEGESKYEAAGKAFSAALEVAPDGYYGSWGMGQLCESQKQWREAAEWYGKVGELQSELKPGMLSRIGGMYLELAEYDRAEQAFTEAFKLDSSMGTHLLNLADDYYRKYNMPEDARRLFKKIRELQGKSFEAIYLCRLGNVDYYEENYDQAIKYYEAAIAVDPKPAIYYENLSDAHKLLKNWAEARKWLDEAFKLDPENKEYDSKMSLIFNDEGNQFYAQGHYEDAIRCYTEAEKLAPTSPRYVSNRALALEQMLASSSTPLELLDRAIADAQKAVELAKSAEDSALEKDFSDQLSGLQRRRRFVSQFGLNALTLDPREKVIRLYLRLDILLTVINSDQTALSDEFMKLINDLHSHLTEKSGLRFPTIMVYPLDTTKVFWSGYQLEMQGEPLLQGNLDLEKQFAVSPAERLTAIDLATDEPGIPSHVLEGYWLSGAEATEAAAQGITLLTPQEYLLRCVEISLSQNLDRGCGHQEVANMLEQAGECSEIRQDPEKLHEFTLAMRYRYRSGGSVPDLKEFCPDFNSRFSSQAVEKFQRKLEPNGAVQTGYRSLQLGLSPKSSLDRNTLNDELAKAQTELFNRSGVIIPQTSIVEKEDLEPNQFQVLADDKELIRMFAPGPNDIAISGQLEELRVRYPNGRSLFHASVGMPAWVLPRSEGLEEGLKNDGYSPLDALSWVLGTVFLEAEKNVDLFLTSELLEYYLSMLNANFSSLVAVTRHYFTEEALLELLRGRLRARLSIKSMPDVLEFFLSDPTTETAAIH